MVTFRLDQQPWIPVVGTNGSVDEVSLKDVFLRAPNLSGLAGSPLEVAAISRFLLAIAHLTETPTSLQHWSTLWENRTDYMQRCAAYVEMQSNVWDLYHEIHPFGQLPTLDKTLNPAHILIYDAARKNNAVFTDHSIEGRPAAIPTAVLARGLLVTNAYAGSSGGGYRSGPLAMRSTAMLCGRTIDETLILNLLVQQDTPVEYGWKLYGHLLPKSAAEMPDIPRRYLWTSRTVRLLEPGEQGSVTKLMLAPGNNMSEVDRENDPMVVLRKNAKGTAYVPLRLEVGRGLWRSAHVLLAHVQDTGCNPKRWTL